MTDQRPHWADALATAFNTLKNTLAPLRELLKLLNGSEVSETDLVTFLGDADENDAALTAARIAMGKWDSEDKFADDDGTETAPRTPQRRAAIYRKLDLSADLAEAFTGRAPVFEKPAIVISTADFETWYAKERKSRASVYWDDYEAYLQCTKKWPAKAITALDESSTEVIERLSRPTRLEAKKTKGLVVGYVQSGKTANFTAVAAKAIDVGYRLIIVLTGTIEILRSQTQRRMDMELVGMENILGDQDANDPEVAKTLDYQQDAEWQDGHFVKHGAALEQPEVVPISRLTGHRGDYESLAHVMTKLKFPKKKKQKPLNDEENLFHTDAYVAVIKKNSAPLTKLIQDLKPLSKDLPNLPVLIIDDESDQASVDTTNPAKWDKQTTENQTRSAINGLITQLVGMCPRAQYVGYTATPFANVFVDPDDECGLFPADFVLSLDRPPGYMGVQEFHDVGKRWDDDIPTVADSNELAYIRALEGDADTEPEIRLVELQAALDAWVLSGAIKKFREAHSPRNYRHHTMLIHESVLNDDHAQTAEDVRKLWHNSKFVSNAGFARLQALYEKDFAPVMAVRAAGEAIPGSFAKLHDFIKAAHAEMTNGADPVLIVNADKTVQDQQKKLDFDTENVWRILVGGTKLSRGFTVEGLTVSYFRRKAGQADTLMQAGRWFGFRPGYHDLVRLYIRRDATCDLYEAFEALLIDEEVFRAELKQYEGFNEDGLPTLLPRQIPPLVSQHLPWLKPTGRNKMWNAVIVNKAPTDIQDLYTIPEREDIANRTNFDQVIVPLLEHTKGPTELHYRLDGAPPHQLQAKTGLISAADFLTLFKKHHWHPDYDKTIKPFTAFFEKATHDERITDWVIIWPWPKTVETFQISELGGAVPIVTRRRRNGRKDFVGSDRKHRAAGRPIIEGKNFKGLGHSSSRGLVLVSLVGDRDPDDHSALRRDQLVGLLSIAVPVAAMPPSNLTQWTVINKAKPDDIVVDSPNDDATS